MARVLACLSGQHSATHVIAPPYLGKTVLLWACKRPLPYSPRRPTLCQPPHADLDVIGSMQGVRQRVEQTPLPWVLRSRSGQCSGWTSSRKSHGKRHTHKIERREWIMAVLLIPWTLGAPHLPSGVCEKWSTTDPGPLGLLGHTLDRV